MEISPFKESTKSFKNPATTPISSFFVIFIVSINILTNGSINSSFVASVRFSNNLQISSIFWLICSFVIPFASKFFTNTCNKDNNWFSSLYWPSSCFSSSILDNLLLLFVVKLLLVLMVFLFWFVSYVVWFVFTVSVIGTILFIFFRLCSLFISSLFSVFILLFGFVSILAKLLLFILSILLLLYSLELILVEALTTPSNPKAFNNASLSMPAFLK